MMKMRIKIINFTGPGDRLDCARVTSVNALSARVIGFSGTLKGQSPVLKASFYANGQIVMIMVIMWWSH